MPKDYEVDEALVERLSHTIVASLKDTKWKLKEIKRLPAGEINWTFRGWLATPQDGSQKTVIIKHAEEDVALHPGWALSLDRSETEMMLIRTLSDREPVKNERFVVRTPSFLSTAELPNTILMEDIPNIITMIEYLAKYGPFTPPDVARNLGISLGKWLRDFHEWLNGNDPKAFFARGKLGDNTASNVVEMRDKVYIGSYKETRAVFPEVDWPANDKLERIEADIKRLSRAPTQGIHGDYGLGNILIRDRSLSEDKDFSHPRHLFVIDFEMSHLGSRAQDLGQMLADLYTHHHFRDGLQAPLQMMKGLIEGYFKPADQWMDEVRLSFAVETALHFGVHITVMPYRMGWTPKDRPALLSCAIFGNACLLNAYDNKISFFGGGPLHDLFPAFPGV